MTNLERIAPLRINGAPAETWRALVADARRREADRGDAENWAGAPSDEGRNNN